MITEIDLGVELLKAYEKGAQSKQAEIDEYKEVTESMEDAYLREKVKVDELRKRIEKTDSLIMSFGDSIDVPLRNSLIDAIRGLEDL